MDPPAVSLSTAAPASIQIGVGVLVVTRNGEIFFRKGRDGSLALPAGHLNIFEDWVEATRRIVSVEMNAELVNIQFLHVTNDCLQQQWTHYVSIFMAGRLRDPNVVPTSKIPDNSWQTYSWEQLKGLDESNSLFGPLANLVSDNPETVHDYLFPHEKKASDVVVSLEETTNRGDQVKIILLSLVLGICIIALAILLALVLTTDSCDEVRVTGSIPGPAPVVQTTLSPTASPSNSPTDRPIIQPTGPFLPPPDVDFMAIACSPNVVGVSGSCQATCSKAACCNYPTSLQQSCLPENFEDCLIYHSFCWRLDSTAVEVNPTPSLPQPNTELASMCTPARLSTVEGIQLCRDLCAAGSCCFDTRNGTCAQGNESCEAYAVCLGLTALEFIDEDVIPAVVEDACSPTQLATEEGLLQCESVCSQAICCFEEECSMTNRQFCGQYTACSVIFGKPLIEDSHISGAVDELCAAENIASDEGLAACEAECSKAVCCFSASGGDCSLDCTQYEVCADHQQEPETRSLRRNHLD